MTDTNQELEVTGTSRSQETPSAARLQRLLEISTTLSSTLDLKQLLEMVIEAVTDLTDTESASILLMDWSTGELYFAAATGMSPPDEKTVVPLEGSIAGWIVQTGEPIILDDVQADERHFTEVDQATNYVTRNMLGVPLIAKGRVIGALEAINRRSDETYSRQELGLLQALASQSAVAIENARLFQQTDLIAEFMHELKTPLMALTAASELLDREDLPEKQHDLIDMIQKETARLSKMAQDFLDLARLESGRTHVIHQSVDLVDLVQDVVDLQEPQAAARDVKISTDLPADLPAISGDYNRLKQVLLNLTSNAIKYNLTGGRVVIKGWKAGDEVVIEITDTGPGIPAKNLPFLFERFYRVPDGEGFSEGTGLGLSIANRIVEEHGGRIEVKSEVGIGSSFFCYLPS